MILSQDDARALSNKILALSKADSCIVTISGSEERYLRYAQNMATTAGSPSSLDIAVESHFGLRSGSASASDTDDDSLANLVAQSEQIARLAPENPEFMPPVGPQTYVAGSAFAPATQAATSDGMAAEVKRQASISTTIVIDEVNHVDDEA